MVQLSPLPRFHRLRPCFTFWSGLVSKLFDKTSRFFFRGRGAPIRKHCSKYQGMFVWMHQLKRMIWPADIIFSLLIIDAFSLQSTSKTFVLQNCILFTYNSSEGKIDILELEKAWIYFYFYTRWYLISKYVFFFQCFCNVIIPRLTFQSRYVVQNIYL